MVFFWNVKIAKEVAPEKFQYIMNELILKQTFDIKWKASKVISKGEWSIIEDLKHLMRYRKKYFNKGCAPITLTRKKPSNRKPIELSIAYE